MASPSWVQNAQAEMDAILDGLAVEDVVKERFREEKVHASTVKLLNDQELEELGLCMGDRASLREKCGAAMRSKAVGEEVRAILSPLPHSPAMLPRRTKGKGKYKLAVEKYSTPKGRKPATKFQRKLVVLEYMGSKGPKSFGLKESYVLMRGILPEMSVDASEGEIRHGIFKTMRDSEPTLRELTSTDFEFMEASGKCMSVPAQQVGFEWTGRAVKQLSGTGAVYVRLLVERELSSDDSSQSSDAAEPEVKVIKVEPPGAISSRLRRTGRTASCDPVSHDSSAAGLSRSSPETRHSRRASSAHSPTGSSSTSVRPSPSHSGSGGSSSGGPSGSSTLVRPSPSHSGLAGSFSGGPSGSSTLVRPSPSHSGSGGSSSGGPSGSSTLVRPSPSHSGLAGSFSGGPSGSSTLVRPSPSHSGSGGSSSGGPSGSSTLVRPSPSHSGLAGSFSGGPSGSSTLVRPSPSHSGLAGSSSGGPSGSSSRPGPYGQSVVAPGNLSSTEPVHLALCGSSSISFSDSSLESPSPELPSPEPPSPEPPSAILSGASDPEPPGNSRNTRENKAQSIVGVFPDCPLEQLTFLLHLYHDDVDEVISVVLEGVSLDKLLELLKSCHIVEGQSRRLVLEEYHEDPRLLVEEAVAFYKSSKFCPSAELRVVIEDQPPYDVGGVRRQFLSDVFTALCTSKTMRLFEGPFEEPVRLRPVFRHTSISSGLLTLAGKMVGHSIVMDGVGFPHLSRPIFYYMAGHMDRALMFASMGDASAVVQDAVSKLVVVRSEEELGRIDCDLVELMDQSGCDLPIKVKNIPGICDAIITHDVLHKRKVFLDCFAEGLEVFSLRSAINAFPERLEPLFVAPDSCSAEDVLGIVTFEAGFEADPAKFRVAQYFKSCIQELGEDALKALLRCVTGSPYFKGNAMRVVFSNYEEGFRFGTCGGVMTISTRISDQEMFMLGVKTLIDSRSFTMP